MVRFTLDDLDVFFPYPSLYPEQFAYMCELKDALDAGAPLAEGHFDENGRWWESPLPASTPKAADARPRPAEPSPRGGASTARERAEQMRERWVNIRRQQVDVGADERRAIERVSKFLRDAE